MSYPTDLAAALSGATRAQLAYWRQVRRGRPALLVPEFRDGWRYLYSFRDIIALRTFAYLRESVSLQRIRVAVQTLERLGDQEHLAQYQLVPLEDGNIVWVTDDAQYIDLVNQPGQTREPVVMEYVFGPFTDRAGNSVLPLFEPLPNIVVNFDTLGGWPVVRGTRVPYDSVSTLVRDGVLTDGVSDYFPSVNAEGAADAVDFAKYVDRRAGRIAA